MKQLNIPLWRKGMKGERTSRISGKVILGGEHAVVYGVPALAMPIEQGLEIRVARSSEEGPWR